MNLNYITCPCKTCKNHSMGCHTNCEDYKEYRAEYDKEVQKINKERYVDVQLTSMKKERHTKLKRKYGEFKP